MRERESPGEIKRREVSWTLTKKLNTFEGPGEIKRREVSWTLTKKLNTFEGPGEIKRREVSWTLTKKFDAFAGAGEIKRRKVVLDPQVSPEEIKSREVELGLKVGLLLPQLFLDSCATDIVSLFHTAAETAIILCSTLVAAQWRGDTALTFYFLFFYLVWQRCTASWSSGFGACDRAFTLSSSFSLWPRP